MKKMIFFGILLGIIVSGVKTVNYKVDMINYKEGNEIKFSEYLKEKVNENNDSYESGNKNEMFKFEHVKTKQTDVLTDYRYIGNNPNNYIYFNCDNDVCEKWRIIGIFKVDDGSGNLEERVKIVRGYGLDDDKKWNSTKLNDWTKSDLNTYLNDTYLNSLSKTSQNMIGDTLYYLGGGKKNDDNFGNVDDIYTWERGDETFNGALKQWVGKIALVYPSDEYYTYGKGIDNVCTASPLSCDTNNNAVPKASWLYNSNMYEGDEKSSAMWFLSPVSDNSENAFLMYFSGYLNERNDVTNSILVRPTLYLKSDVYYISGDGSSDNPYKIVIKDDSEDGKKEVDTSNDSINEEEKSIEIESNDNVTDNTTDDTISTDELEEVVDVGSTSSLISNIIFIISGLLIIVGISVYGYNYYKLKNRRNL